MIVYKMWTEGSEQQSDSLELKDQSKYRVEWRAGWESSSRWSSTATGQFTSLSESLVQHSLFTSFLARLQNSRTHPPLI